MDHKDILEKSNIKEDLKDFQKWYYIIPLCLGVSINSVLVWCAWPYRFLCILLMIVEVVVITCLIKECMTTIRYYRAYKHGGFTVKKDVLSGIGTAGVHFIVLRFSSGKRLYMSTHKRFYKWSQQYCFTHEGLWIQSEVGDTFYIVTDDGKTPLMVYNTKLFEYKE